MSIWISFDGEYDGPVPGLYSMVCFGAVVVEDGLERTFYTQMRPLARAMYNKEALAISGFTREQHEGFPHPADGVVKFARWVNEMSPGRRPIFCSDNPGDWSFINYYLHLYNDGNPFGWSGRRIGDLYCGMKMDTQSQWKFLRKTIHDHNPVNDAKGNAEAILAMRDMGLKIKLT